jgi:hypothetical protein
VSKHARSRVLGATVAAVALSLFFVGGALAANPHVSAITLDKWSDPTSLPVGGGDVTYWYAVKNISSGPGQSATSFLGVAITDDTCDPVTFDHSSDAADDDQGPSDKLDPDETWWFSCGPVNLTVTTTNKADAWACTDSSTAQCNNKNHNETAHAEWTVTVATNTATIDDMAKGAGALALALVLLAIGGFGFLATTNRLPKLPKFR